MAFKPRSTNDQSIVSSQKTLMYGPHGFGKTTQAAHLQRKYGKTFIISGEGGLRSIMNEAIDYMSFTSWGMAPAGVNPNEYSPPEGSLQHIRRLMRSPEFEQANYKAIVLDSLTEASDLLMKELEAKHADNKNGFEKWGENTAEMIGTVKWIRDLPYHVLVTALAKEEQDDNGKTTYWPMVQGSKVAKQLPGIFDNVFCGIRRTAGEGNDLRVSRYIVTEEVGGWHGKVRDPNRRLRPVERGGDMTELLSRMELSDSDHENYINTLKAAAAVQQAANEEQANG